MSYHLTYVQAVVTGLVQGVTELFPVSSLGHNVLIPALIGGSWAQTLNVSAPGSPYLAFIVGLHVATAVAMIAFFWRDWLRIVRGFFTSLTERRVATPDQRLAWLIILGTIPVGIVGLLVQKEFIKVFAKPELAAAFLAINGLILLGSERMRRPKEDRGGDATRPVPAGGRRPAFDGPGGGGQGFGGQGSDGRGFDGPPPGYSQQPRQQQWQGPDPRYGQGPDPRYGRDDRQRPGDQQRPGGAGRHGRGGAEQYGQEQYGQEQYGQGQYGQGQYGQDEPGAGGPGQYERDPRGARGQQPSGGQGYGQRPAYGQQPAYDQRGRDDQARQDMWREQARQQEGGARGGSDPWASGQQQPGARPQPGGPQQAAGRHGQPGDGRRGDGRPGDGRPGDGRMGDGRMGDRRGPGGRPGDRPGPDGAGGDPAVAADRRLSTIGYKRAVFIGAAQILALLPGISRDGIVTVAGMGRGLTRQDAVRFSFLLSAPVILAAGVLKVSDLTGPNAKGIHGPIIVGSIIAGVGAYLSIRFLTKYFSEDKSLNPFGFYCIIAGLGSLAYLVLK